MHVPTHLLHVNMLAADCESQIKPVSIHKINTGNHFCSSLHPNNDLFIRDRGSMYETSSVTTGEESSLDRETVSAHILLGLLTIFDCGIVLLGELNAYLDGEEKRH